MSTQDNQKDLEMATETLSEYLERDITSECLSGIKQKVQDKYRYVPSLVTSVYLCSNFQHFEAVISDLRSVA